MKVVIVGATGNVGTSVLRALARDQRVDEIVGVARRNVDLGLEKVRLVQADVSRDNLAEVFRGAAAVVHLAWLLQPERNVSLLDRVNVRGSRNVFRAAMAARVPALIYASSVGAYAPGPRNRTVEETWPTTGIPTSLYSQQKVAVERILDTFERANPSTRVVRMRPALIFKRGAGSEIRRYFLGPLAPRFLFKPKRLLLVPDIAGLRVQCVHSIDIAEAYRLAIFAGARGAFNIAAEPPLDPELVARLLEARRIKVPVRLARAATAVSFRLHLQRSSPGWLDMALQAPLLDTFRARHELGWRPAWSSTQALIELMEGIHQGAGVATPPLAPSAGGAQPV